MDFTIEPENTNPAGDGASLDAGSNPVGDPATGGDGGGEPVADPAVEPAQDPAQEPAEGQDPAAEGEKPEGEGEGPSVEFAELQGKFDDLTAQHTEATQTIEAYQQEAQQFVDALKADPFHVLEQMGINPRQAAEAYLTPIYEREAMEPAQRQALEAQELAERQAKELERYRQQEAERQKAESQDREQQRMIAEIESLAKANGLPQTQETIPYFARALSVLRQTNPQATLKDAVPMVKQAMETSLTSLVQNMTPEQVLALLGPEGAKGVRQHFVKTATGGAAPAQTAAPAKKPTENRQLTERDVWADWGL